MEGIDTRKVHDDYILMSLQLTFFFLDRNTRPVTYKLIGSGQCVEQSSLLPQFGLPANAILIAISQFPLSVIVFFNEISLFNLDHFRVGFS